MKTCWGGGVAPSILVSALERGEWSASRLSRFIAVVRSPGTYWIGDWVPWKIYRTQIKTVNLVREGITEILKFDGLCLIGL